MKLRLLFVSILFVSLQSPAALMGEFYFSPQWGGTEFTEQNGTIEHKRSWDFFYNTGVSFGLKGGFKAGIFYLGVGGEYGWKEESFNRRVVAASSSTYATQMSRFIGGAHLALYPISNTPVHFYFEYDPLVSSRVVYTENNIVNPFRKNDTLSGTGRAIGLGLHFDHVIVRFINRWITYDKMELSGVERDLPDTSFSELKTDEFVFQVGSTFK